MAKTNHKPGRDASGIPSPQERRLTVARSPDHLPGKFADNRPPAIRLKGKWLAQAGFLPTRSVRLRVCAGCIVITLD